MGLTLLERGSVDVYVDIISLRKGLYALVVGEWDSFVQMNPCPPESNVVRRGATANEVEFIHCSYQPYGQLEVNVATGE